MTGTVLVTGGASGIGLAAVRGLVGSGHDVCVLDRAEAPAEWRDHDRISFVSGDVTDPAAVAAAATQAERLGPLTGVLASAGIAVPGTVESISAADWHRSLAVNLTAVFLLAQETMPRLRAAGGGSFVAVASQHGLVGDPANAAYCAAKAGVINLMRCLALDHAGDGIRANAVCPGPVETPMTQRNLARLGISSDAVSDRVPLRRLATADEIAAACLYLLGPDSGYVTGSSLVIDGGYTAG